MPDADFFSCKHHASFQFLCEGFRVVVGQTASVEKDRHHVRVRGVGGEGVLRNRSLREIQTAKQIKQRLCLKKLLDMSQTLLTFEDLKHHKNVFKPREALSRTQN